MARQYAPKTFIRQVRGALLNRCLRQHGIEADLNIEIIKPAVVETIFQRLMALPPEQLRRVEQDFATISELADATGTQAILREGARKGLDLTEIFLQARNGYERACWTFLEHPTIFDLAACFCEMDRYGSGRWNRRYVGSGITPAVDPAALVRLSDLMRNSYSKEGRGKRCHIDYYLRQEPDRHCFFAYPENHAKSDLAYTKEGELDRHTHKPAFEVIFVYRPEDGMLEILAPGGRERVDDMASCFSAAVLGLAELPTCLTPKLYDLSPLLEADLAFTADGGDGIDRVELREICLNLGRSNGWKRRLTFAADDKAQHRKSIHELIHRTIRGDGIWPAEVIVSSAKFRLIFHPVDNQQPKRLTFSVATPDRCSLRDNYHDQIARTCLRRWGLALDATAEAIMPGR